MSKHYSGNSRKRKSRREKIGFYTAFSICLIAVCMAVFSTYNTVNNSAKQKLTDSSSAKQVNQPVTGVHATPPAPTIGDIGKKSDPTVPTGIADTKEPTIPATQRPTYSSDALQTMLAADISLGFPVKGGNVLREYSKESVYFKTLNVWKPHSGVDFAANLGDDVMSMSDGEVTKVGEDKLLGKTVDISVNNVVCTYCGLGDVKVKKGDTVKKGDKIGVVGTVPCEASDKNHIHVEVKVNGTYADPISFINNED